MVYRFHLGHFWVRSLDTHKKELDVATLPEDERHGLYQGRCIEPIPDTSSPQNHLIVGSDGFIDPFQNGTRVPWGFLRYAERCQVYEAAQGRIALVVVGIHSPHSRKHAQPIVALSLIGAQEKITRAELEPEGLEVVFVRGQLFEQVGLGFALQSFQQKRVVHV